MPKFHFNLRRGDVLVRDEAGMPLPDIETAREVARERASHLRLRMARAAKGIGHANIEITDSMGRVIDSVAVASVNQGEAYSVAPQSRLIEIKGRATRNK
jgi:hypothetical protein